MSTLTILRVMAVDAWRRLQLSYHGGKYSIQRGLALEVYSRDSSLIRVTCVCFGTPLPMLALVLAMELVPLQDPSDGWSENVGFWIRTVIILLVGIPSIFAEATDFIDGLEISLWRRILVAMCTAIGLMCSIAAIASYLSFPVPFVLVTTPPLMHLTLTISFRLIVGIQAINHMLAHRDQTTRFLKFLVTQFSLMLTYAAYETLFYLARGSHCQLAVVLLLPALKLGLKNAMIRCTAHKEDMTPVVVIFTVDFFNAIYMATCMQNTSSSTTIVTFTVTDLVQTITMLHTFHRRTAKLLLELQLDPKSEAGGLLSVLCALCRDAKNFTNQTPTGIRVYSNIPHKMSAADSNLLTRLGKFSSGSGVIPDQPSQAAALGWASSREPGTHLEARKSSSCFKICSKRVHPRASDLVTLTHGTQQLAGGPSSRLVSFSSRPAMLSAMLETLFTTECLIVTAYLEAVVPFFYCCYVLAMTHLPNARYHTDLSGISRDNVNWTVLPVLLFGLLQIASLALLAMLVKRNCGFNSFHQLAFVLSEQVSFIQGNLMFWIVLILSFRVVHFGTFLQKLGEKCANTSNVSKC